MNTKNALFWIGVLVPFLFSCSSGVTRGKNPNLRIGIPNPGGEQTDVLLSFSAFSNVEARDASRSGPSFHQADLVSSGQMSLNIADLTFLNAQQERVSVTVGAVALVSSGGFQLPFSMDSEVLNQVVSGEYTQVMMDFRSNALPSVSYTSSSGVVATFEPVSAPFSVSVEREIDLDGQVQLRVNSYEMINVLSGVEQGNQIPQALGEAENLEIHVLNLNAPQATVEVNR